jgi:outer membrane protein assembly factor BamB
MRYHGYTEKQFVRRLRRMTWLLVCASTAWVVLSGQVAQASITGTGSGGPSDWTVYHGNYAGTGVAPPLKAVDTKVRAWTSPTLEGEIYGEPLVFSNRVYVATENDTVYALSAANGVVVWSTHVGRPVPAGSLPCGDIGPTVGITGTPVIDPTRQEIFAVADELQKGKPVHVLVGLSTATGKREMSEDVDPPRSNHAAMLQRTGLTLDDGRVIFGFGGNDGDCSTYRGRVIAVPETGGKPRYFTVDAANGESQGAVWMGGGAPAVDSKGHIWVSTGNGSVYSYKHAYDHGEALLELSPSLRLLQFFAPTNWAYLNSQDLDMSIEPALLADGQVILSGKDRLVYLLNAAHLGGIGKPQAKLGPVCSDDIDGGVAVSGMTVYLPCLSGTVAVRATESPPALKLLWRSTVGGGPPIVAAGLVWTIGQNGKLYGLNPANGKVRQQATIGVPANHFPTPSVGDGLLLAACSRNVIAFRTTAAGTGSASGQEVAQASRQTCQHDPPGPPVSRREVAAAGLTAAILLIGIGWLILERRRSLKAVRTA